MHVSLDSALGRQRRLNSVGESIMQIAPNPVAAYSLRSLTGGDPRVVRVRRDSDNDEQDFNVSEVNSGALVNFVNTQVTKPLDVKELQSDGRTGNFVIANAAYSLRSLGDRQATILADSSPLDEEENPVDGKYVVQVRRNVDGTIKSFTADEVTDGTLASFVNESFTSSLPLDVQGSAAAAYSLRNLSSTYEGPVVNVRRSSDNATSDFTADSITNGGLVAFVNEEVLVNQTDASWTGWSDVGNASSSTSGGAITVTGATASESDGIRYNAFLPLTSNKYRFVFNVSALNLDGATSFQLKGNANNVVTSVTSTGSYSVEHTVHSGGWGNFINFTLVGSPSSGASITIDSLQIYSIAGDGHVATWYDQSGNSNNATQGTPASQPKIVSAGSLLTKGITFDGSDFLSISSVLGQTNRGSYFAVYEIDNTSGNKTIIDNRDAANDGSILFADDAEMKFEFRASSSNEAKISTSTSTSLTSAFKTSSDISIGINGGTLDSESNSDTINVTTPPKIGVRNFSDQTVNFMSGEIAELIVYNSDVSEKRRAIEESIATNYSITLASFSRDGFVRTWYDQSVSDQSGSTATGNHATQTTPDNQPKIVEDGSLLIENSSPSIKFDGTNDNMHTSHVVGATSTVFAVCQNSIASDLLLDMRDSSTDGAFILSGSSNSFNIRYNSTDLSGTSGASGLKLGSFLIKDGSQKIRINGTEVGSATTSGTISVTATTQIGGRSFTTADSSVWDGDISEIIIYNSDQTDNQGAFEANMGDHYNISGIPTQENIVNGFVETWYDQSGNGKDLTQTTADSQPKIVNGGSLVTLGGKPAIKPDGSNDFMQNFDSVWDTLTNTAFSCFTVAEKTSTSGVLWSLGDASSEDADWLMKPGGGSAGDVEYRGSRINTAITAAGTSGIMLLTALDVTSGNAFVDGQQMSKDADVTPDRTCDRFTLFGRRTGTSGTITQALPEIIFYGSDQASNRVDVETNMNNFYTIF